LKGADQSIPAVLRRREFGTNCLLRLSINHS
jgi:hypothetical protein